MKKLLLFIWVGLCLSPAFAQQATLSGTVTDSETGEGLFGANIVLNEGVGTTADFDGNYSIQVPYGTYTVKVSYIGYERSERTIELNSASATADFGMRVEAMKEVKVIADVAIDRETPVAFFQCFR